MPAKFGLDALSFELLGKVATSKNSMVSAHALLLLKKYRASVYIEDMKELATDLMARHDTVVNLYLAISLGPWATVSQDAFLPILAKLSQAYSDDAVYQEAIVSSLGGMEESFQKFFNESQVDNSYSSNKLLMNLLSQTVVNKRNKKINSIFVQEYVSPDSRTNGLDIFQSTCITCHGADGEGKVNIGPPLRGSQYIEGPPERLAMIILNGLEGTLIIRGKFYKFNGSMPNFGNNFTNQQIADVIKYLHNSFVSERKKSINAESIKILRNKRSGTLTEKELLKMNY